MVHINPMMNPRRPNQAMNRAARPWFANFAMNPGTMGKISARDATSVKTKKINDMTIEATKNAGVVMGVVRGSASVGALGGMN